MHELQVQFDATEEYVARLNMNLACQPVPTLRAVLPLVSQLSLHLPNPCRCVAVPLSSYYRMAVVIFKISKGHEVTEAELSGNAVKPQRR